MKYKVLFDLCLNGLEKKVNVYLKKGWKCQGGIYNEINREAIFYQAMIKLK